MLASMRAGMARLAASAARLAADAHFAADGHCARFRKGPPFCRSERPGHSFARFCFRTVSRSSLAGSSFRISSV